MRCVTVHPLHLIAETKTQQTAQLDHSEGAKWLLANQGLLEDSKLPIHMKEDDATSIKAKEQLDVKGVDTALGLTDGDDRAGDQVCLGQTPFQDITELT